MMMTSSSFWYRLDQFARQLFPFALTIALLLVSLVPLRLPAYSSVTPSFMVMAVYFWTLYRPDLMPLSAVFVIGLLQDLLTGGILGVSPLVLLTLSVATSSQRRFLSGGLFVTVWAGFVVNAAGAAILAWLLNTLAAGALYDPRPALFQYLFTVGLYPTLGWILARAQRTVLRPA
jgi:rod shape-determining protein MreD